MRTTPLRYTPGLRKFGSHDEMIRERERREAAQVRAARSASGRST